MLLVFRYSVVSPNSWPSTGGIVPVRDWPGRLRPVTREAAGLGITVPLVQVGAGRGWAGVKVVVVPSPGAMSA